MNSYELAEVINQGQAKMLDEIQAKQYSKALGTWETLNTSIKPYLDTQFFTCNDYKDREEFNLQARKDAMDGYKVAKTAGAKHYYTKLYNLCQQELQSLWFSWKPFIKDIKEKMDAFRRQIVQMQQTEKQQKKS